MTCLAGVDLGTSSLKVVIMDEDGVIRADISRDYQYNSPINGYAEQDIDVWWQACVHCFRSLIQQVGAVKIAGIGFSGQMHGAVFLDEHLCQVRPAILHLDARSGKQIQHMQYVLGSDVVHGILMNPLYSGFLIPSLLWVKENEPGNYSKIRHVLLPKDYLRLKLSGELNSDFSDASATLAFDIRRAAWSEEVLDALNISHRIFPRCLASDAQAGRVTSEAAAQTGLLQGTPIITGGGDQVMQSIGNGVIFPGQATINVGTSAQVSIQADRPIENPALNTNTFCSYNRDHWYTMGATMSAGLSMKWLGNLLGTQYGQLDSSAEKIAPGAGGLLFLPYLSGERTPHLNPDISGMFWGLSINTGPAQMARAVMEGVAYSLRECIELCGSLGLSSDEYVASGGGTQSPVWLQIQADVYGVPLKVTNVKHHAGVGAAIVAGSGIKMYHSIADGCRRVVRYSDNVYMPNMDNNNVYNKFYQLYRQAYSNGRQTLQELTLLGRHTNQ